MKSTLLKVLDAYSQARSEVTTNYNVPPCAQRYMVTEKGQKQLAKKQVCVREMYFNALKTLVFLVFLIESRILKEFGSKPPHFIGFRCCSAA